MIIKIVLLFLMITSRFAYAQSEKFSLHQANDDLVLNAVEILKESNLQQIIDQSYINIFNSPLNLELCRLTKNPKILAHRLGMSELNARYILSNLCQSTIEDEGFKIDLPPKKFFIVTDDNKQFDLSSWTDYYNRTFLFIKDTNNMKDLDTMILHEMAIAFDSLGRSRPKNYGVLFRQLEENGRLINKENFKKFLKENRTWRTFFGPFDTFNKSPEDELKDYLDQSDKLLYTISFNQAFLVMRAFNWENKFRGYEQAYSNDAEFCQDTFLNYVKYFERVLQKKNQLEKNFQKKIDDIINNSVYVLRKIENINPDQRTKEQIFFLELVRDLISTRYFKFFEKGAKSKYDSDVLLSNPAYRLLISVDVNDLEDQFMQKLLISKYPRFKSYFAFYFSRVLSESDLIMPLKNETISFCQFMTEASIDRLDIMQEANQGPRPPFTGGAKLSPSMPNEQASPAKQNSNATSLKQKLEDTGEMTKLQKLRFKHPPVLLKYYEK